MFAALILAATVHGGSFQPTPVQAHRIIRIVSHLPVCGRHSPTYAGCREIGGRNTFASFPADHGVYFVRVTHRPGHRHVAHAEFYPDESVTHSAGHVKG